jgi:hypothetical protein
MCVCCGTPVYEVLETFADGPRAGEARRIGLMTEAGTQAELMLSDGSVCHFDVCTDCAPHLQPEHLLALWDTHVARTDEFCRIAGRRENQRRAIVRAQARLFPVGVLRWRRQDQDLVGVVNPSGLVIDRRRPTVAPPDPEPARDHEKGHAHG